MEKDKIAKKLNSHNVEKTFKDCLLYFIAVSFKYFQNFYKLFIWLFIKSTSPNAPLFLAQNLSLC